MNTKSTLLLILTAAVLPFVSQAESDNADNKGGKGKRPNPEAMFAKLDTDSSGGLSKDEVKGRMAEHFNKIDTDENGQLSKKELKAARSKMENARSEDKAERKGKSERKGKGEREDKGERKGEREGKGERDSKGERPDGKEMFIKLDTDKSGSLSKDEVKGRMAEHFDRIDTDDNGELSKKEMRAAHKKRAEDGKRARSAE
jgi:Ca2+-binding EF-hand superfamily protein